MANVDERGGITFSPQATYEYKQHLVAEGFTAEQATSLIALVLGLLERLNRIEARLKETDAALKAHLIANGARPS
jgi:hypothetical protein